MFYATWSKGFRPGGINRRGDIGPYAPDFLYNIELGWKTTFGPVRWNGAIYHELWKKMQFAFLGANSFTEIHNGKDARVNGIETDINYIHGGLTLNAAAAYTDAKTKGNICNVFADTSSDCSADGDFITAPSGTRLPVTPKFKASATARYTWPVWTDVHAHVQGAVSYQGSAPSSLRIATQLVGTPADTAAICAAAGATVPNNLGLICATRTCSRASSVRRLWSISLRVSIFPDGTSRPSRPTSSTSEMSSAVSRRAAAARALWSCPAARAPSAFAQG